MPFLSAKKLDKELPALKEFVKKTSMREIFKEVELVFTDDKVLSKNVKMYLCQRYTGSKLKEIGLHFGIGESGISQACRRISHKIEKDKKLKKNGEVGEAIKSVKNEDLTPVSVTYHFY